MAINLLCAERGCGREARSNSNYCEIHSGTADKRQANIVRRRRLIRKKRAKK